MLHFNCINISCSRGYPRAVELLADLVQKAGDRVIIMPGAGLTPENIKYIH